MNKVELSSHSAILKTMKAWIEDENAKYDILMLRGGYGMGKTTIVNSLKDHGYNVIHYSKLSKGVNDIYSMQCQSITFSETGDMTYGKQIIFLDDIDGLARMHNTLVSDILKMYKQRKSQSKKRIPFICTTSDEYNSKMTELSKNSFIIQMNKYDDKKLRTIVNAFLKKYKVKKVSKQFTDSIIAESNGNISFLDNQIMLYSLKSEDKKSKSISSVSMDNYKPLYETVSDMFSTQHTLSDLMHTYESDIAMYSHMVAENYVSHIPRSELTDLESLSVCADLISESDFYMRPCTQDISNTVNGMLGTALPCMAISSKYGAFNKNRPRISFPMNIIVCASRNTSEKAKISFFNSFNALSRDMTVFFSFRYMLFCEIHKYKKTKDDIHLDTIVDMFRGMNMDYTFLSNILRFKLNDQVDHKKMFTHKVHNYIKDKL